MADEGTESNAGKWILVIVGILFIAGTGYGFYDVHNRLGVVGQEQSDSKAQIADLSKQIQSAQAEDEALAHQLGITKKELGQRAAQLQREQKESEARLTEEQKKQIGQVTGQIGSVETEVGGVKTDVASTKTDLAATQAKLQSTIGDLGIQSGLIANTRGDLDVLKHKGDRNYYEFTLIKGAKAQPVGTISLQLKKTDDKHGKFTVAVTSDDKTVDKKDRNISEPIQFYSGRDHLLFELVVWTVDKKKATGYLSTPKAAPVPVTTGL
jgi:multidrug efflux pump subunit AcrA (membrane-fusion protein)